MSKRIITTMLLLFLIFNLSSCFDTDDLFDNVITPAGSVPENTEKSTEIEFTEEPTEEQTEETIPAFEQEGETDEAAQNMSYTFTTPVVTEEIYEDSLDTIRTMLTSEPVDYSFYKLNVSADVKHAFWSEGCNLIDLEKFENSVYLGGDSLLFAYENVYGIDGNLIGEEYSNSFFLVFKCRYILAWLISISNVKFENGILTLGVEYGARESGDDGYTGAISVVEIDKSVFAGEEIISVEFIFYRTEE